jgi:hypothetical protein
VDSPTLPQTKTLMGNVYRLGGHLANLAPAATLFTPFDAHVDRDGNDKPMHTVAFDVNRLCKQRPRTARVCGRSRSSRLRLVPTRLAS